MKATNLFLALAFIVAVQSLQAQNVELDIERSVKVEFNSKKGYSYNVYGTSDPAKKTGWKLLGGEEGTGENIVFFYRSEADQKVFFRVESEPSEPGEGPKPQEPVQSIIPITGLPPAESSGTYNLLGAIGENEIGGVYRIGVSPGTDGVVIELPHPGQKEYRQKQIKLSIYRGGTGLGSGKVSLKVPTLAGGEYETRKLVDNSSKQLTDEVVVLAATALESGRKVVVDLFNDTTMTAGAAGGQWVVTTAAEAVEPTLVHEWDGANVRLKNADGSWGHWVNLRGQKGDRGDLGSSEYEWRDTEIRFKKTDGTWGQWVDLQGPLGGKGAPGSISAQGYDISMLFAMARGDWSNQNFDGKDLSGSVIRQLLGKKEVVHDSSFVGANLTRAKFFAEVYINCDFRDAVIEEVDYDADFPVFINCNLQGARITYLDDFNQIISWENFDSSVVKFIKCTMPDGSTSGNGPFGEVSLINLDLSGIDFSGLDLSGFDFTNSKLQFANMQNLKSIENVNFTGAVLFGVKFSYLNDDGELRYFWERETEVTNAALIRPTGEIKDMEIVLPGVGERWVSKVMQTVPENLLALKWNIVWEHVPGEEKYYFSEEEIYDGCIVIDLDTSNFYNNNRWDGAVSLFGTCTVEGDKNKPTKLVRNEVFDHFTLQWESDDSGTLTFIDDKYRSFGGNDVRGTLKAGYTFEKLNREQFIKEVSENGDGQLRFDPAIRGGAAFRGSRGSERKIVLTKTTYGTIVVRSSSEFALDRLEIALDADTGSELVVGQVLKPSDLGLSIGVGVISDDDAIIVVEETPGGGKKLLITSKTSDPFLPADVAGANAVPVEVSIPTAGGGSVSVDVDLVAPMKSPNLIANVDETGSAKSINITTDGFTEDEADAYIATIEEQFGNLDNFEINGETLNADEVDIITSVVPTGDPSTPFRVEVVIKPKDPDGDLGQVDAIAFVPPDVEVVEGAIPPPIVVPPTPPGP